MKLTCIPYRDEAPPKPTPVICPVCLRTVQFQAIGTDLTGERILIWHFAAQRWKRCAGSNLSVAAACEKSLGCRRAQGAAGA
jgi:hypothetical protein